MRRMSRKPSVVSSATRAPFRSISALVATVVPWTKVEIAVVSMEALAKESNTARDGCGGRGGDLRDLQLAGIGVVEDEIGERSTGVDAGSDAHRATFRRAGKIVDNPRPRPRRCQRRAAHGISTTPHGYASPDPDSQPPRTWGLRFVREALTSAARALRDLLDTLERHAEEVGGVPDTEAEIVDEAGDRVSGGGRRFGSSHGETCARAATPAHGRERIARQSNVIDELGRIRAFDPQRESFTNTTTRFDEAATMTVTTRNRRDVSDPGARLVALEYDAVGHRSHFFPRHGSRSRSIARSVPGGRSTPRWIGTVVWQRSQRIRTCDPSWRTTSHPSSLSFRRTCTCRPVNCSHASIVLDARWTSP